MTKPTGNGIAGPQAEGNNPKDTRDKIRQNGVFSELVILVVKDNGTLSEVDGLCTCYKGGSTAAGRCPPLLHVCSQLVIDEATVESADAAKATVLQRGYFITLRLETKIRNTRKKTVMNSRVGGEVDDHAPNPTNIMQK